LAKQDSATSPSSAEKDESLLLDQRLQKLVQQMVDHGVYTLTPRIGLSGIVYEELKGILPDSTEAEIKSFLNSLVSNKIFETILVDKVITCPACHNPNVLSKYICPRCSAFDIGRASIIEHTRCGYLDSKDKFQKGDTLLCPKCKSIVRDSDYRKIGTSFQCNGCGTRFETPRMSHKCVACDDVFTFRDAIYEPIFEYKLSEDTKRNLAKGTIPLSSIVAILKEGGYEVKLKSDLPGKSGATHTFDIVARKGSELIVANFTFNPKEEDIIGLFAKKYDIDPTHTWLIALTPASKEEEAVSKAYGVKILYATGAQSLAEQIQDISNERSS